MRLHLSPCSSFGNQNHYCILPGLAVLWLEASTVTLPLFHAFAWKEERTPSTNPSFLRSVITVSWYHEESFGKTHEIEWFDHCSDAWLLIGMSWNRSPHVVWSAWQLIVLHQITDLHGTSWAIIYHICKLPQFVHYTFEKFNLRSTWGHGGKLPHQASLGKMLLNRRLCDNLR